MSTSGSPPTKIQRWEAGAGQGRLAGSVVREGSRSGKESDYCCSRITGSYRMTLRYIINGSLIVLVRLGVDHLRVRVVEDVGKQAGPLPLLLFLLLIEVLEVVVQDLLVQQVLELLQRQVVILELEIEHRHFVPHGLFVLEVEGGQVGVPDCLIH
jgi:hypothetical protein